MKSDFFIDRPIFSTVISVLIVLVGLIGLMKLPVDQYPDIVPPVVTVTASYPGASAMAVSQAVATPIEQALNGSPGMIYMESTSTNSGSFTCMVTFDINTDPDLAAVEIQNRVQDAEQRLPAEVVQNGLSIQKEAKSKLLTITLQSTDEMYDEIYLSNYATLNVVDMIRRVPGVGRVSSSGSRYYAMQIWAQPDKLASMGLTVKDLQTALKDQNRESAAGVLGQPPMEGVDVSIPITATGRLSTAEQFENIVVRATDDGAVIRMKDVARVSLEAQSYSTESGINGEDAAVINIYMLQGQNAMEVAGNVKAAMEEISANFPDGITYDIPFDATEYISESIHHVYRTLFEALILVILVVFLSLQSWRATLIPAIAVPISLIGTFGMMLIFGFSLNLMTLLGLILAIGLVVDDAIVVVENVDRIMEEEHLPPKEATKKAMSNIGSALIAMSLVLCAVFVPVSFLSGISGSLYRQFTITIAVSVIISTIVALTLSPAMCAAFLKPHVEGEKKNFIFRKINEWFAKGNAFYTKMVGKSFHNLPRMFAMFGVACVGIIVLGKIVPTSFMPQEDQGYFTCELELPVGATIERTRAVSQRAMDFFMRQHDIEYVLDVRGTSPRIGTNQANVNYTVIMKPWKERKVKSINKMMQRVRDSLTLFPEAKVYLSSPAVIPGLGTSGGFSMVLEAKGDCTYEQLQAAKDTLMYYASQRKELTGLSSNMQSDIPQLYFDVDRDKTQLLGVPVADVFSTLKAFTGSVYINDFNMFNRIYRVYLQADAPYRERKENLNLFFVKSSGGAMVPVSALGNAYYTTGPGTIKRFDMFYSATINGEAAHGTSSGQAMAILESIVREHLPSYVGVEWSGLSYQEKKESGKTGLVLMLCFVFVFLFLAAQYESWWIPVAVLLTLPIAIFGAYLGIFVLGYESNVYFQIGLVMLVGLAAKNAILIVEFAKDEVVKGRPVEEAAVTAARLRFRPIVMTALAFLLGMLPLVFANGPGCLSRRDIGTGVFFGMIVATCIGIVFVPFFFVMIHKARKRFKINRILNKRRAMHESRAQADAAVNDNNDEIIYSADAEIIDDKGEEIYSADAEMTENESEMAEEEKAGKKDEKDRKAGKRGGGAALLIVALIAAGMTFSCSPAKYCADPELNLPEQFSAVSPLDSLTIADLSWSEIFIDTTLQRLIRDALEYNKDLLIATERLNELQYKYRVSNASRWPALGSRIYTEDEVTDYHGDGWKDDVENGLKLTVSWEIDLWGKFRWATRQSKADYLAGVEAQRAVRMEIIANVVTAYFELQDLDRELSIVNRTLITREEGTHQAKLRFEGGLTSETSYQQSLVELASAASMIPELERQVALKESQLAFLCGSYPKHMDRQPVPEEPTRGDELSAVSVDLAFRGNVPVGVPSDLLWRRPDLRQKERALESAMAAVGVAQAERFPTLTLSLIGVGWEDEDFKDFFKAPYYYPQANFLGPIFQWGKRKAKFKAAISTYEQARLDYEKAVMKAFKEVYDATVAFNSAQRNTDAKYNLREASRSYVSLANMQYINGVINYLDLLDAQRSYLNSQMQYSKAVVQEYTALVALYKALGGGWQDPPDSDSSPDSDDAPVTESSAGSVVSD